MGFGICEFAVIFGHRCHYLYVSQILITLFRQMPIRHRFSDTISRQLPHHYIPVTPIIFGHTRVKLLGGIGGAAPPIMKNAGFVEYFLGLLIY